MAAMHPVPMCAPQLLAETPSPLIMLEAAELLVSVRSEQQNVFFVAQVTADDEGEAELLTREEDGNMELLLALLELADEDDGETDADDAELLAREADDEEADELPLLEPVAEEERDTGADEDGAELLERETGDEDCVELLVTLLEWADEEETEADDAGPEDEDDPVCEVDDETETVRE
ncbi:hypothetical protein DFH09DRAFT_1322085 [Mycena vulgaris]|nr:hypothetical protein DFH09DRAFT_1322085 [Mycena vulgaris]